MVAALKSKTGQNTQIVFGGEILGAIIGFAGNLLLLRYMSVSDYGLYSLFLSSMMLISGFMHFGWVDTYVRYGSKYFHTENFAYIRRYCGKKVLLGVFIVIFLVSVLSPWISSRILQRENMELFLIASAFGGAFNILFSFTQNDYRIHNRFSALVITKSGSGIFRLLGFLAFLPFQTFIPLIGSIIINLSSLFIFCLEFLVRVFKEKISPQHLERKNELKLEMKNYNKWILVSFLCTTVIGNIDLFILSHYHPNQLLGNYGAATRLTLPFQLIISALTTAMLPRLHQVTNHGDMKLYLKRVTLFLIPTVLLLIGMIAFAPPILVWVAGPQYGEIGTLIRLQLITTMIMVLANPYGLVLNAWGWSKFFALLNLFQVFLDILLDILWIPTYGAEGAIAATMVVNIVGLILIYLGLWFGFKKHRPLS
jgi:O-antigen/teichoic acid export membrane protein